MASYSQMLIISAALIFTIASIPVSTAHRRRWRRREAFGDADQYIRDLCSKTERPDVCQHILKSDMHRFEISDEGQIATGVVDLAIAKSQQIGDQLNQWYVDSNDERMKEKYHSCAENYFRSNRYLEDAQRNMDSKGYRRITNQIEDSERELEQCREVFEGSPDPGHVEDRINEFRLYLDMVRAATTRLEYYD